MWAQVLPAVQVLEETGRKDESQLGSMTAALFCFGTSLHPGSACDASFINWCSSTLQ